MKYLFIFEDGTTGCTDNDLAECDLVSVDEGILSIFKFKEGKIFEMCGGVYCEVEQLKLENSEDGDYHGF